MKRLLVDFPERADPSTGLSPRVNTALAVSARRSNTPRLESTSSPRQAAAARANDSDRASDDTEDCEEHATQGPFSLGPPCIPVNVSPLPARSTTPSASHTPPTTLLPRASPVPAAEGKEWATVPARRRSSSQSKLSSKHVRATQKSPPPPEQDDGWNTVPVRRAKTAAAAPKQSPTKQSPERGASKHINSKGVFVFGGDDDDDDADADQLIHAAYTKHGRNPRGKKSNNLYAVLKREGATAKREAQRNGLKR
jgi:hypothetical protein